MSRRIEADFLPSGSLLASSLNGKKVRPERAQSTNDTNIPTQSIHFQGRQLCRNCFVSLLKRFLFIKENNLFVGINLTHLCQVDFSTLTLWIGPFPVKGLSG